MAADMTKLLEKILPDPGAEDVLRLRVGTVLAVNSDGTVDVEISQETVPDVPRLAGAYAPVGEVVQVISFRGSLLVIGGSASNDSQVRPMQAATALVSTSGSATTFSTAVVFPQAYPASTAPHVRLNHSDGNGSAQLWVIHATSITDTGFNILGARSIANTLTNSPVQWNSFVP